MSENPAHTEERLRAALGVPSPTPVPEIPVTADGETDWFHMWVESVELSVQLIHERDELRARLTALELATQPTFGGAHNG